MVKVLVRDNGRLNIKIVTANSDVYRISQWTKDSMVGEPYIIINNGDSVALTDQFGTTQIESDCANAAGFGTTTLKFGTIGGDEVMGLYTATLLKTYHVANPNYITGYTTKNISQNGGSIEYHYSGNAVVNPKNQTRYDYQK